MSLTVYNTLTRKKEIFTPIHPPHVGMYKCGPTVYSHAHIGHAKSYVSFDIILRYLRFLGYDVTYVQNITDVGHLTDDDDDGEDKMLKASRAARIHPMQIAEMYTRSYYEDMDRLNILRPDIAPRATAHIIEQLEMIKKLIANGNAYEVNGSVYFDVTTFPDYGKLSGRKIEDQESSGRVEVKSEKRNPQDFALWKRAEKNHILQWPSPWGMGFPGWHIECSAMSMKYLGELIDIHGGGLDNLFPHHECEIAQSECVTFKPFVKYWFHNNLVTTSGQKMGKSLGNAANLKALFEEFDPLAIRFFLLQSHYRSTTEFSPEAIEAAAAGFEKLLGAVRRVKSMSDAPIDEKLYSSWKEKFCAEMDDDFNAPKAVAVLFDAAREANTADANAGPTYAKLFNDLAGNILGILPPATSKVAGKDVVDSLMSLIIKLRAEARARKDFGTSDEIRDALVGAGITLEDGKEKTTWKL